MKIEESLSNLTPDEKLRLLTGEGVWTTAAVDGKVPSLFLTDGPHGLKKAWQNEKGEWELARATAYPSLSLLSNAWNPDIARRVGAAIAEDCIENDVAVLLAPGVNIKRTPLCGRNFEYFSADPYLAGVLARAYITGVQSKGVGACLKHFCANNREFDRFYQSNEVDERTLREIYMRAFEIALEAKPWTVMCSYNPVNGVFMSENKKLLDGVLRKTFGFDGLIVSDWDAVHDRAKALKATVDLQMPGDDRALPNLEAARASGFITPDEIDAGVKNVLRLIDHYEAAAPLRKTELSEPERHALAVEAAQEGMVLLKNDGVLPLKPGSAVSVVGEFASDPPINGGGSSTVNPRRRPVALQDELKRLLPGSAVTAENYFRRFETGLRNECPRRAQEIIYRSDVAVVCVGNLSNVECEVYDRESLKLNRMMEQAILRASELNPNVVVALYSGSAVDMSAWIDRVKGVVLVGYAGEGVHEALAGLLCGNENFSGKLSETFPLRLEDTFTGEQTGNGGVEVYRDGIAVDYRRYDALRQEVLFPFGFGLSYAEFDYSDLEIEKTAETDFTVRYTLTNRSNYGGREISQIYVTDVLAMVVRPEKELKGFRKDFIAAGESKRVEVRLSADAFAYYSTVFDGWHVENGDFEILVGASSRDIRLRETVKIELPYETQQTRF